MPETNDNAPKLKIGKVRYVKYSDNTFIDLRHKQLFDYLTQQVFPRKDLYYTLATHCGGFTKLTFFKNIDLQESDYRTPTLKAIYKHDFKDYEDTITKASKEQKHSMYSIRYLSAYSPFTRYLGKISDYALLVGDLLDGSIDVLVPKFIRYDHLHLETDPSYRIGSIENYLKDSSRNISEEFCIGFCSSVRIKTNDNYSYYYGLGTNNSKRGIANLAKEFINTDSGLLIMSEFLRECSIFRKNLNMKISDYNDNNYNLD